MQSKGLQKLKWYCEMCQKQCRDENGFKCHTTSEGHLRQMRVFTENPHQMVEQFSQEVCTSPLIDLSFTGYIGAHFSPPFSGQEAR